MSSLLNKYKIDLTKDTKIEWKTSCSDENSILFYKIQSENRQAWDTFVERINSADYLYCIINSDREINRPNIIRVSDDDWLPLQKEICDKIYPYQKKFKSVAVTGTNGKTTTVDLIRQLMIQQNK